MSYFVSNGRMNHPYQGHMSPLYDLCPTRSSTYAMAVNAGILKAVVSFYRIDSATAFERHRSRIPVNDVDTVLALKKQLI